jgi:hypothetical protein
MGLHRQRRALAMCRALYTSDLLFFWKVSRIEDICAALRSYMCRYSESTMFLRVVGHELSDIGSATLTEDRRDLICIDFF